MAHSAEDDVAGKLVGTWRLRSSVLQTVGGGTTEPFGPEPKGSIIITANGRMAALLSSRNRQRATNEAEQAALQRNFMGYTGRYTIEGDKIITMVDLSWNEVFSGAGERQVRYFTLDGDVLTLRTAEQDSAVRPGTRVVATLVWVREP